MKTADYTSEKALCTPSVGNSMLSNSESSVQKPLIIDGICYFSSAQYELAQYACKARKYTVYGQILQAANWKQCLKIIHQHFNTEEAAALSHTKNSPITLNIKLLPTQSLASGHQKEQYGIEIQVNDHCYPICFGSKEQTLLYIAVLLNSKTGKALNRKLFNYSLTSPSWTKDTEALSWLTALYKTLFPYAPIDFQDWYPKMKASGMHAISQAKSQVNNKIRKALGDLPSSQIECLLIQTERGSAARASYRVTLPSAQIQLTDHLQELLPSNTFLQPCA